MSQPASAISAEGLTKTFQRGREEVVALDRVSIEIRRGEFVAITGPSGAGKTTLLSLLGCMDTPTSGTLRVAGQEVQSLNERGRTRLRREKIGFVFQHFGLIPTLTVAENIALPALFSGRNGKTRLDELLECVDLQHRCHHRPHQLSGGEMQRVAIARALANDPQLVLADEPTGNLDTKIGNSIIGLLQKLNRHGVTIVVVTHNAVLADAAQRQIALVDGRLK
ncbi:MAG TPA: ABC transporter ATP-binding protein [Verrucomicrobiae bacterium]|nr:ABC transporter ATP-binding protein [Verrucomicrobiae bacterium]